MNPQERIDALTVLAQSTGWKLFEEHLRSKERGAFSVATGAVDPILMAKALSGCEFVRGLLTWVESSISMAKQEIAQAEEDKKLGIVHEASLADE